MQNNFQRFQIIYLRIGISIEIYKVLLDLTKFMEINEKNTKPYSVF